MYHNARDRRRIGWISAGGSVEGVGSISAKANRDGTVSISPPPSLSHFLSHSLTLSYYTHLLSLPPTLSLCA
ncbi:unnamed protein product, partial [Ectocarpus sp. 6 AP-2014]